MSSRSVINELCRKAHENSVNKGFWEAGDKKNIGEMICLIHSELSEAFEEYRNGHALNASYYKPCPPEKLEIPNARVLKPEGVPSELADVCIRVFDFCDAWDIDLGRAIEEKMAFNKLRAHKHGNKRC